MNEFMNIYIYETSKKQILNTKIEIVASRTI